MNAVQLFIYLLKFNLSGDHYKVCVCVWRQMPVCFDLTKLLLWDEGGVTYVAICANCVTEKHNRTNIVAQEKKKRKKRKKIAVCLFISLPEFDNAFISKLNCNKPHFKATITKPTDVILTVFV